MKRLRQFLSYIKKERGLALLSLLFATISVASKMALPFLAGKAIDEIKSGNTDIAFLLIAMTGFLLSGCAFRFLFDIVTTYLGQKVVKRLREEAYKSMIDAPISYLDKSSKGDLIARLTGDIETIQTGLISGVMSFYEAVVQMAITVAFMFAINYFLAIVLIVLSPISLLVSKAVAKANSKNYRKMAGDNGALASFAVESIDAMDAISSYGALDSFKEEFEKKNKELASSGFKAEFASCWINPSTRLVNNALYAIIIIVGSLIFLGNLNIGVALSIGGLSSFLTYATQFMTPFNEVSNVVAELLHSIACFDRVNALINTKHEIDQGEKEAIEEFNSITVNDVHFGYEEGKEILKGVNVTTVKGKKVAIVGKTGCGKTTLFNLLMRFYDPASGSISFGNNNINEYKKDSLRASFGLILQEPYIKKGTIRENLTIGKMDASDEEIYVALDKAGARFIVDRFAKGLDAVIGNTSSISLGEKQLLSVARLMLDCPDVVLLDEATSNIDLILEKKLGDSFDELLKGKTSFIVAHRLSTIKNADIIYVMDEGVIKESGTFQDLLALNGVFSSIYQSQF